MIGDELRFNENQALTCSKIRRDKISFFIQLLRNALLPLLSTFKITEFHIEDPDLKSSTLEIGFPSCAIEKDNFIDSQGKQIRTENKEFFKAKVRKQRDICIVVAVAVLVAKGPYYRRGRHGATGTEATATPRHRRNLQILIITKITDKQK